ncbi:Crotonobetainyl-CoA:carnitine CoA-transferase CaiB [Parafrankia irregularis]|uniref:Crotonobetainyl-CoA:carnitine CoA-transferase CaiB n=1 Tax=Parafrankia irregularis TaxID=795642 RepID=A0A0S4QMW9_9ACTN|nr:MULTISPECIES: CoA transferase [Parafrankia]MBE3200596.1 CoA transferase [Parafrankia sp. CH37]CUU56928.1 Crotonobetainyl-CoA:carnitine CoA-transferase CaiB [Parafrankia irregularis]
MTAVMKGVRVLEVAEHTFVPAASALLADWGAEVIKIEHVERGDAMRGLASTGTSPVSGSVHVLLEHSNRHKKSLALDLTSDEGLDILYRLATTCDIFLTNKLPRVRAKLKIDVEHIRAHNPNIIYARGTGQGERGADADRGSYDFLAFWARAGIAAALMNEGDEQIRFPPAPGFGDSIGAMTIAGGLMGALFHRERTGEATIVDVSLLGAGMWSMGQGIALADQLQRPLGQPPTGRSGNPLVGTYRTGDDRFLVFSCLQAARYWPELCTLVGRPDLVTDPRFVDHAAISANTDAAFDILAEVFAQRTLEQWRETLRDFSGQWAVSQTTLEITTDPQAMDNGYLQDVQTSAGTPFRLVAAPVQYDEQPAPAGRAPDLNEHGDEILQSLGLDWDEILNLKIKGVVA